MMTLRRWWAIAMACVLSACGGGGGGGDASGDGSPVTAARVVVTATGPSGRIANGGTAVLDVVVTNTGAMVATNVVTTIFGYDGVGFTAIDCTAAGGAVCPVTAQPASSPAGLPNRLQYTAATLPPQGSLHFRVTELLRSVTSGPMRTTASIKVDGQASGADVKADVDVTTYIVQLTVSGGALTPTGAPGSTATYVMALSNAGPDAASNLIVTNDVGLHQTLVSATCVAAGGAVCPTAASNGARMTVPSLPVGGNLVFTMTAAVAADATGVVSDVFSAIDPGDRFPGDNVRVGTTAVAPFPSGSFLVLRSDPNERLGRGGAYAYTQADAFIEVSSYEGGSQLFFSVAGNESWGGRIKVPTARVGPGTYNYSSRPTAGSEGSFSWYGNNVSCTDERTQVVIDSVTYSGDTLSAIDLRFDQTCEGSNSVLHGQLHWTAADTTQPPGPVNPPPAALWRAPAGSTPSSGNYVYLRSDAGDASGDGETTVLTQANAIFSVQSNAPGQVNIRMQADADVDAYFRGISTSTQLRPGYHGPIQMWPSNNPTIGSMSWSQEGKGCNSAFGWFVIDDIQYAGTSIASIDARFEQHCGGAPAALRGQIHWAPGDPTLPPGPVYPPPADLWSPAAGATPVSGNYVYLQSDAGDVVGQGGTYVLTPSNYTITATTIGADLKINAGPNGFDGEFVGMNSISRLQPGYYADLKRFPFHNPTRGGMTVGVFVGCNVSAGWFVVDSISYTGDTLTSIDLRFEQHCEGAVPALHGKIHWTSG